MRVGVLLIYDVQHVDEFMPAHVSAPEPLSVLHSSRLSSSSAVESDVGSHHNVCKSALGKGILGILTKK